MFTKNVLKLFAKNVVKCFAKNSLKLFAWNVLKLFTENVLKVFAENVLKLFAEDFLRQSWLQVKWLDWSGSLGHELVFNETTRAIKLDLEDVGSVELFSKVSNQYFPTLILFYWDW